ncbi:MAG: hypothetical protein IPH82_20095 [Chloroflexi bacterium]|nr:hypothetical protein [Chloroflexota bacterium]
MANPTAQSPTRNPHLPAALIALGLTAVFVGYLAVWLPGPAVGLQFLGVELGEWVKFWVWGKIVTCFTCRPSRWA